VIKKITDYVKNEFDRVVNKLQENYGGVYIIMMWVLLAIMLIMAVYLEYSRISHILKTVDTAYERALTTVAVNNYDEIYENVREEEAYGGGFNGGNEGEYGIDEAPIYFDATDYGEIEDELVGLLGLTKFLESEEVSRVINDSRYEYSLRDFEAEIRQDGTDIDGKYRVDGKVKVSVPIYFMGQEITSLELEVKSKATWRTRW